MKAKKHSWLQLSYWLHSLELLLKIYTLNKLQKPASKYQSYIILTTWTFTQNLYKCKASEQDHEVELKVWLDLKWVYLRVLMGITGWLKWKQEDYKYF